MRMYYVLPCMVLNGIVHTSFVGVEGYFHALDV